MSFDGPRTEQPFTAHVPPGLNHVSLERFCRDKAILMRKPEMTRTAHITIE
jgi:hypothetical protein